LPFDGTSELATGYSSAVVADLSLRDSNLPVCDILRFSGPGQVFSLPEDLAEPLTTTITFNRRFAGREKAPRSLKFRSADESDAHGIVREFVDTGNRHYMPRTHEVETEDVGWINITGQPLAREDRRLQGTRDNDSPDQVPRVEDRGSFILVKHGTNWKTNIEIGDGILPSQRVG
jgi:hypothetical protein